jgi:hypothetical protein
MGLANIGYLIFGLVAITAVILGLRSNIQLPDKDKTAKVKKPDSSETPRSKTRNPYLATAIVSRENCCAAVTAIGNTRFLVADNDVPPLPLLNCNVAKCACTYAHFADRRDHDGDRRGPIGLHSELHRYVGQLEKRLQRGRRVSDWA